MIPETFIKKIKDIDFRLLYQDLNPRSLSVEAVFFYCLQLYTIRHS